MKESCGSKRCHLTSMPKGIFYLELFQTGARECSSKISELNGWSPSKSYKATLPVKGGMLLSSSIISGSYNTWLVNQGWVSPSSCWRVCRKCQAGLKSIRTTLHSPFSIMDWSNWLSALFCKEKGRHGTIFSFGLVFKLSRKSSQPKNMLIRDKT